MKKEQLTKLAGEIVFTLAAIFLLSGETRGASSASRYSKNNSENQHKKLQKENQKRDGIPSTAKVNKPGKQFTGFPQGGVPIKTVSLSELTPDTPFGEAIDIFRNSTEPPLNIVVFWRDLEENSDVDRYTPIGIEHVSGVSLGTNLKLMLMSVSSDPKKLGYVVENGVVIIATKDSLPTKMRSRVYNVTDLVGAPANYFAPGPMGPTGYYGMPYGGMGYGGYGRPYGSGGTSFYGRPYGGAYGRAYGAGTSGRAYGFGRYSGYPYSVRGSELGDLIGSLYGPSSRTRRNR